MQKFIEVRSDYQEPETGNIAIDAYLSDDDEIPGRTVCWVSPDGTIIKGTNPECEPDDLECDLVKQAIAEAMISQEEDKQKLVDDVIDELKKDASIGDYTVLDELLRMIPVKNLIQSLPEEVWEKYNVKIK